MAVEPVRQIRLDVKPGLYALRYVSSTDVRTSPTASVQPVAPSSGALEIVSAPGTAKGELGAPGSSVVIVASAPGVIEISLTAFTGSQNLDAKFSLDLLGAASPAGTIASTVPGGAASGAALDLLAHVSRRGDVKADEDGWIAGPRSPSSIEAVRIQVRGADLGVAAQFRNTESRSSWSNWTTPGTVIGVPQRACALTGVRFKLVGPEADRYEILGEGLFLGTPKISVKGGEIELVAPGELDPLIGLRLSLAERAASQMAKPPDKVSRVRVFR